MTWLSTNAAAARAGVSVKTIRRWIARGLAASRPNGGRLLLIRDDVLDAWISRSGPGAQSLGLIELAQRIRAKHER